VVTIFTRSITDDLASLVKQIDAKVGHPNSKTTTNRAFLVLLSDDPDADSAKLKALAKKHKIKNVPLTIFDGIAGPPSYKINKGAEVTVLMWTKAKIKVNRGFAKGELTKKTVKSVVADAGKVLTK